jgi:hypothetical protein
MAVLACTTNTVHATITFTRVDFRCFQLALDSTGATPATQFEIILFHIPICGLLFRFAQESL